MTPLDFIDMGIAVIPISYRSKRPNKRYLPNGEWQQYQNKKPCRSGVEEWLNDPLCNFAVVCGWNGLVIVDFDNVHAHEIWIQSYGIAGFADTYTVSTGRGWHYYFFVEDAPPHTMKWVGGEVKASGYCLIPPSIHPTGRRYEAVCPDNEIMTIGSIYEILPESVFAPQYNSREPAVNSYDAWNPAPQLQGGICADLNQSWRILDQFPDARRTGNGWFTVQCPLHSDGQHWSGWIDDNRNRYGCHACVTSSLSAIDFNMALRQCSFDEAIARMT